jgi:Protein of unknown function (DUF2946)
MDEQVLRSLIKWPNVPACYGWLALDRRGKWRMRDEFAQQNKLPGQAISHQAFNEYISRNYAADEFGRYFFQNGPQRVFVTLDATPWVVRIYSADDKFRFITQCNKIIEPNSALSDQNGNIYIVGKLDDIATQNHLHVALLHDHDLDQFSELAKLHQVACSFAGSWRWQDKQLPLEPIHSDELSGRFGFIANPSQQIAG